MAAKILVVDDDESMRELLRLHLRNAGYEVELAEDAVIAGTIALNDPPDLMIVDVEMPYMDGFELVAMLKADAATRQIPVMFLTVREDGREIGKQLGANAYLTKPVVLQQLLAAVAKCVPAGRRPSA